MRRLHHQFSERMGVSTKRAIRQAVLIMAHTFLHDGENLYIMKPNVGEVLGEVLGSLETRSEQYFQSIFMQIVKALENLQEVGMCHRNLQLENLMIDQEHNVTLTNFKPASTELQSRERVCKVRFSVVLKSNETR